MIHLGADSVGYLLPFAREYKELYRLPAGIHDIVEYVVLHGHHTETEHHLMSTLQIGAELWEEHTRTDNTEVGCYQYRAQRHVVILVD